MITRKRSMIAIGPLCLILLASLPAMASAQASNADCLQMVRGIYKKLGGISDNEKIAYTNYTVRTTVTQEGKPKTHVANVELTANNRRLQLVNADLEVYQDLNTAVTVVPANRMIYIGSSNVAKFREQRGRLVAAMQDTLFSVSDVVECVPIASGGSDRRVVLRLHTGAQQMLRIATLTFLLNTKQGTVQKIVIDHLPGGQASSTEVTFNRMDLDYRAASFAQPLGARFFNDRGDLLPKYTGYQVIDTRPGGQKKW